MFLKFPHCTIQDTTGLTLFFFLFVFDILHSHVRLFHVFSSMHHSAISLNNWCKTHASSPSCLTLHLISRKGWKTIRVLFKYVFSNLLLYWSFHFMSDTLMYSPDCHLSILCVLLLYAPYSLMLCYNYYDILDKSFTAIHFSSPCKLILWIHYRSLDFPLSTFTWLTIRPQQGVSLINFDCDLHSHKLYNN